MKFLWSGTRTASEMEKKWRGGLGPGASAVACAWPRCYNKPTLSLTNYLGSHKGHGSFFDRDRDGRRPCVSRHIANDAASLKDAPGGACTGSANGVGANGSCTPKKSRCIVAARLLSLCSGKSSWMSSCLRIRSVYAMPLSLQRSRRCATLGSARTRKRPESTSSSMSIVQTSKDEMR